MRACPLPTLALAVAAAAATMGACRQAIDVDKYYAAPSAILPAGADASVDASVGAEASVGADGSASPDAGAIACGMTYGGGTCNACATTSCCDQLSACALNPACSSYEACLGACNDSLCRSQCTMDHQLGPSPVEVSALSACLASSCETTCGLTCGAVAGYVAEPAAADACEVCIEGSACHDARLLGSSPDGDAYWRCVRGNSTEDLRKRCAADHPTGAALFEAFNMDWSGACRQDCGYGRYWACVTGANSVGWPIAGAGMVTTTVRVVYFVPNSGTSSSLSPVVGANVAVCTGCPCGDGGVAAPLGPQGAGTTDDAGIVTLTYPNQLDFGQHGLSGCFDVTSPTIDEMYVYWDYPVTVGSDNSNDPTDYINAVRPADVRQLLLDEGVDAAALPEDLATRGEVAAVVKDCLGNPAPNVTLQLDTTPDPTVQPFYGMNLGAATATDSTGVGGFYNVPPGTHLITAWPAGLAQPSSQFHIQVAAGVVTETQVYPVP